MAQVGIFLFSRVSTWALGTTQPCIQCVVGGGDFSVVMWFEASRSLPSNVLSCTYTILCSYISRSLIKSSILQTEVQYVKVHIMLCCASLPHFVAVFNVISKMLVPHLYSECVVGRRKTLNSCWRSWITYDVFDILSTLFISSEGKTWQMSEALEPRHKS